MSIHGEGQLTQWVREYAAGELTLDELAERVDGFAFATPGWHGDSYWEKEIPSPVIEVDTWEELQWAARHAGGDGLMSGDDWYALLDKVLPE